MGAVNHCKPVQVNVLSKCGQNKISNTLPIQQTHQSGGTFAQSDKNIRCSLVFNVNAVCQLGAHNKYSTDPKYLDRMG